MKKTARVIVLGIVSLIVVSISSCTSSWDNEETSLSDAAGQSGWELVWEDEFGGDGLDASKWTRCTRGKPNWKDTMSDDPGLLIVDGGVVHLRGIENDDKEEDPAPYLSAGITNEQGEVLFSVRQGADQGAF